MAINLEKAPFETLYYYAENGNTVGPFPLKELLPRINADTLVYREGIDWTNAKDVEELKAHFPEKPKKPFLLIIICVVLFTLIGVGALIAYKHMNKQEQPTEDTPNPGPGVPDSTTTVTPKPSSTDGTSGPPAISDPPKTNQPEIKNSSSGKTSIVKQEDLFTCPNGRNIRENQVNDGICDCEDDPCSDESKN